MLTSNKHALLGTLVEQAVVHILAVPVHQTSNVGGNAHFPYMPFIIIYNVVSLQ